MQTGSLSCLQPHEMRYIHDHFRFSIDAAPHTNDSFSVTHLLHRRNALAYLDELTPILRSPSRTTTAAQFSKRYAFAAVAGALYAMTMYDKGLNLVADNCHVESTSRDGVWLPNVRLADGSVTTPDEHNRDEWRDQIIKKIFADNVAQVWQSLAEAVNISPIILWENTAVYIYWLYETKIKADARDDEKAHVLRDFDYLIHRAPGSLFGERQNPLAAFYGPKFSVTHTKQPIRFRKTCCFYYDLPSSSGYCDTCPKLKQCQKEPVPPEAW